MIPPVATATPVGHARLSRPRAAVRRDARVEGKNRVLDTGVGSLGKSEDLAEQGSSRKAGVRVLRRDRAQRRGTNLAHDLI